jgi:lysophospholipase L1-like esterase
MHPHFSEKGISKLTRQLSRLFLGGITCLLLPMTLHARERFSAIFFFRMKFTLLVSVIVLGFIGSLGAEEPAPAAPQPAPQMIFFLGDSITKAGGYVRIIKEELIKQNPTNPPQIYNFGHMSETVSGLSEAYHPGRRPCVHGWLGKVLEEKPDWVIACYGINDGIYHPFNEKRFAAYQEGIESLIKKVRGAGARLVLLTPPPFASAGPPLPAGLDAAGQEAFLAKANAEADIEAEKDPKKFGYRTAYPYYDHVLARYCKWLLTLDGRDGVSVVDIRTPMLARIKETHGGDAIHPNGTGHAIMAQTFLKQWPAIQAKASSNQAASDKAEVPAAGTAVWELWLPPNGMPVRAVLVCPRWGDGARMVKLVQENLGAKLGVGTMLSWRDAEILEQFKDPAFVASITHCLARSAVNLKRPELANVPLLLWAHSNAAWYLQNSLKIMPERVAAYCLFKSAFGKNNDLGTMSQDAVAAFGQSIWDENDRIGKGYDNQREKKLMLDNLAAARKQGALVHVTLVRGTHHVIDGQEKLMLAFFESAIALRIPRSANPAKGPVKLVSGLEKIGWIQDASSKTVYAPGRYPAGKDPRQGWWLPTREYAEAWNAYALNAKGTVAAPDTPVPKALPAGNAP